MSCVTTPRLAAVQDQPNDHPAAWSEADRSRGVRRLYHLDAVAHGTRAGVPAARPDRPTPSTPQAGVTGRAVRHRSDVRPPLARKMPKGRA